MSCLKSLRLMAVEWDSQSDRELDLSELWRQLCAGAWLFCDTFSTEDRHFALLRRSRLEVPRPLDLRRLRLLESVLLGTPPKVVALNARRSLSSITGSIQECIRSMGLNSRLSHATALLAMAARAYHRPEASLRSARRSELEVGGEPRFVISVTRPDLTFPVPLSTAEAAVVRGLLSGHSYAEISDARATSTRTVANQLATAFRKLGVSGRQATLQRLLSHSAQRA